MATQCNAVLLKMVKGETTHDEIIRIGASQQTKAWLRVK
jgi:hypothetical protein